MSGFFMHTLEIKEFNKYLIIKINKQTPKLRAVGTGMALINFNKNDLFISKEAIDILHANVGINFDQEPVLEIISSNSLWFLSHKGLIIPPGEIMHIYAVPQYTLVNNEVDENLKNIIINTPTV